jgi:Fic-DOC domain mobile mystery protein B
VKLAAERDGATSLSPDELNDLIPPLATRQDLNEWERMNILAADRWALNPRTMQRRDLRHDPLTEPWLRELHRRMFDQTWRWAGRYRATEKNIGVEHFRIREMVAALLGDARYWIEHGTYAPDEIAIRFHHRLVLIHPFPNGNGRHARLAADVLARRQHMPLFTWGSKSLAGLGGTRLGAIRIGDIRRAYIYALRAADRNDIGPLLAFARD